MPQTDQAIEIRREIISVYRDIRSDYRSFLEHLSSVDEAKAKAARAIRAPCPDAFYDSLDRLLRYARASAQRAQDKLLTIKELCKLLQEVSPDAPDVSAGLPADIAAHLTEMRRFLEEPRQSARAEGPAPAPQSALLHLVSDSI